MRSSSILHIDSRLRMRQVALLLAIDEHRSLRVAAEQLAMSQPAATKMLQDLESALGDSLFMRSKRGMVPSAAGELVGKTFKEIRNCLSSLEHQLVDLRDARRGPSLRIGLSTPECPPYLMEALQVFHSQALETGLQLRVIPAHQLLAKLRDRFIDAAVGPARVCTSAETDGLHFLPLGSTQFTVFMTSSHPIVGRMEKSGGTMQWLDIGSCQWIIPNADHPARTSLQKCLETCQMTIPPCSLEVPDFHHALCMLGTGERLVVWPYGAAGTLHSSDACIKNTVQYEIADSQDASWGVWTRSESRDASNESRLLHLLRIMRYAPPYGQVGDGTNSGQIPGYLYSGSARRSNVFAAPGNNLASHL